MTRPSQSMAQEPGPRGSPHEPQAPGPALNSSPPASPPSPPKSSPPPPKSETNEALDLSPPCAANVDDSLSRSVLRHFGQAGFSRPNRSCSNRFEHLRQEYSYTGMVASGTDGPTLPRLPARPARRRPPLDMAPRLLGVTHQA